MPTDRGDGNALARPAPIGEDLGVFQLRIAGAAAALVVGLTAVAWAGGSSLPPDVDLDPDRGMTFGRIGKTRLVGEVFAPFKHAMRSRVMDPSIDPYAPAAAAGRYDPATGKIQGGLSDTVKAMRRRQEAARSSRSEEN